MKTKILAIVCVALFGIFSAKATSVDDPVRKDLRKIVERTVTYPTLAVEPGTQGTVIVDINVTEEGTLEIGNVSASDEKLKNYVVKRLKTIDPKKLRGVEANKHETYKFLFKVI